MPELVKWKFAGICPDYIQIYFGTERYRYFLKMTFQVSENLSSLICGPSVPGSFCVHS